MEIAPAVEVARPKRTAGRRTERAGTAASHAALPLVALVLGIAGVGLGITVIWYFAAIPIGLCAAAVGFFALTRIDSYPDERARGRATIGAMLGIVAIVLGVTAAYFLPRVLDRADHFLGTFQENVNGNVQAVNNGLTKDVDRLDRTLTHNLDQFEAQNRADLGSLEQRTSLSLSQLETRLNASVANATAGAKQDIRDLETRLRQDLDALDATVHTTDTTFAAQLGALEARITRLEQLAGIAPASH